MAVTFNNDGRVRYYEDPFVRPFTPALYVHESAERDGAVDVHRSRFRAGW